jgi:hypothetical protein
MQNYKGVVSDQCLWRWWVVCEWWVSCEWWVVCEDDGWVVSDGWVVRVMGAWGDVSWGRRHSTPSLSSDCCLFILLFIFFISQLDWYIQIVWKENLKLLSLLLLLLLFLLLQAASGGVRKGPVQWPPTNPLLTPITPTALELSPPTVIDYLLQSFCSCCAYFSSDIH